MKFLSNSFFATLLVFVTTFSVLSQSSVSFTSSGLNGEALDNPTSLQFGPDDRLYVSQQNGTIYAYTITKNGPNNYEVTNTETINLIRTMPNHNDDGSLNSTVTVRQVTGILVRGTAVNPILYVTSSDPRIGGGGTAGDKNLDTNSGIVSKLIWNGAAWIKTDLVIGLPRSEENHAVNGMQLDEETNTLYVAVGGHTNAGAPSNNFAFSTEYAYAAAIIKIDLNRITNEFGGSYILPTLDDPTRPNTGPNGSDENDPFGGNDGLNQAKLVVGGPVEIHSPGYRNSYDLVITKTLGKEGRMYTIDNGANGGWGGHPDQEGASGDPLTTSVTNNYVEGEPGSTTAGPNDAKVNNKDNLHLVSKPGMSPIYGGHPNPIRANPSGAGLYWYDNVTGLPHFELTPTTDWPPVPAELANPVEGDYRNPGVNDGALYTWGASTNGLAEYTSDKFFNGDMQGDLLAACFDGTIYRIKLNADGTAIEFVEALASGFGSTPLDVVAQGEGEIFEGTIWAVTYGADNLTIFEPEGSWEEVTSVDASFPIERHENAFVEAAGKFYLIGGRETTTINIYDPALKVWTNGAKLPFKMHHFQAVTWQDKIYVMGAYQGSYSEGNVGNSESPVPNIYIYDPVLDEWTQGPTIPRPRGSAGVVVYNDEFYLIGGIVNGHVDGWVNWVDKYNPGSGIWTELPDAPRERDHFHAAEIEGKIYLTGGRKTNGSGNVFGVTISEVDVYDIAGTSWSTLPVISNVITKRAGAAVATLNGELFLIGGESSTQTIAHNQCEIFNPATGLWRSGPTLNTGRHGTGAFSFSNSIYIAAGSGNRGGGPVLSSMESFSSSSNCSGDVNNFGLDDDSDGYSNGDETLNGTNPCSAASVPNDFDGDLTSDKSDTDDDNDAILDTNDFFALDANNGANTSIPLFYPFLNGDPGTGLFGLGFTGLMSNGVDDYQNLFDPEHPDLIMGGAVGIASVPANGGDAVNDDQENAFQFGFKVNPANGVFVVKSKLQGTPFFDGISVATLQKQSQGIYIGTGDQDTYIKIAVSGNNDGTAGVLIYGEDQGTEFDNQYNAVTDILTTGILYFYIQVDPVNATAQFFYQTGTDAQKVATGTTVNLPSSFADLLDGTNAMAAGIISSSGGAAEFSASWDYMSISTSQPFVEDAPTFYNRFVGNPTSDFTLDLNTVFEDDEGDANMTYEIVSVETNTFINTSTLTSDVLTINFLATQLGSAKVIVKATDSNLLTAEYEFLMQVIPEPAPFLRINGGGPKYGSWSADQYFVGSGNQFTNTTAIANTTDDVVYQTERWKSSDFSYSIPVPKPGYYRVNLHFAEIYFGLVGNGGGAGGAGSRNFNVDAEGERRLSDYDIFAEAGGPAIAIIEKLDSVYVSDGFLNLTFGKIAGKDNPKINGIELAQYQLDAIENTAPSVDNPGDRFVFEGGAFSLQIVASDLNFADVLQYQVTGLPASLSIDPATGLITGTIEENESSFPIVLTVSDGQGGSTEVNFTIHVVTPPNYALRINAGGVEQNYSGEVWQGDQFFLDGNAYSVIDDITNTTKDDVYQSERSATRMTYEIPMPGTGRYNVTLHFAEIFWTEPGKRVFNVNIEAGEATLDNYDIFQAAGGTFLATTETFSVDVTDGSLSLLLTGLVDEAKISGIEITSCVSPVIASFTASVTNVCPGSSTELTATGSLGNATSWNLYSGSCGQTLVESNATGVFIVSPVENTTYFVRGEGGCIVPDVCTSIDISLKPEVNTSLTHTGNTLTADATATAYQWINCAGPTDVSGEIAKTFEPEATGSYAVRVTENGCTDESACFDFVFVGLPEELEDKVSVYPNPASGTVSIDLPASARNIIINIVDVSGRNSSQHSFDQGGTLTLDTKTLNPGIYLMHIKSSSGSKIQKLIVK